MKQIISFSGGIGSFCVLKRAVKIFDPANIIVVFMDTLWEDEDLYRFNDDVFSYLNKNYPAIKIVTLADGRTPFDIGMENNLVLNNRFPLCSIKLKSGLFRDWLKKENITPEDAVIHIGIDASESKRRCPAITKNYKHQVRYLLVEEGITDKQKMLAECAEWGIEIPQMYKEHYQHNNCKGRCFRGGLGHYRHLLETRPDIFEEMVEVEKTLRANANRHHGNNENYSILKRRRNGITERYSLEQLKEDYEREELVYGR